MYRRNIKGELSEALADTPVVLVNGARQTGKSTLAKEQARSMKAPYITLDDATQLAAATADPSGFLKGVGEMAVIDEVQKAPALFPAMKALVDEDRRPGRFLLTGSANVLLLPKISESLAGRMEILALNPLSQGELLNRKERFIHRVFSANFPVGLEVKEEGLNWEEKLTKGGYPEVLGRPAARRREAWFGSYITAILQRDVRDIASINGLTEMPRLLSLLASRVGGLLNMSELSRSSGLPHSTLKRYLNLLEATFIFQPLPPWSANIGKRMIKSPKIHLVDCGLAAHLCGYSEERLSRETSFMGHLLENFALGELRKQATWSERKINLFYFRTTSGREVDVILEDRGGRLVGIEVKASATVSKKDFAGMEVFRESTGERFSRGVLLYCGDKIVPFGKEFYAAPVSALWRME